MYARLRCDGPITGLRRFWPPSPLARPWRIQGFDQNCADLGPPLRSEGVLGHDGVTKWSPKRLKKACRTLWISDFVHADLGPPPPGSAAQKLAPIPRFFAQNQAPPKSCSFTYRKTQPVVVQVFLWITRVWGRRLLGGASPPCRLSPPRGFFLRQNPQTRHTPPFGRSAGCYAPKAGTTSPGFAGAPCAFGALPENKCCLSIDLRFDLRGLPFRGERSQRGLFGLSRGLIVFYCQIWLLPLFGLPQSDPEFSMLEGSPLRRWHRDTRFYQARIEKDLLQQWCLVLEWGQINSPRGGSQTIPCDNQEQALAKLSEVGIRRLKRLYVEIQP